MHGFIVFLFLKENNTAIMAHMYTKQLFYSCFATNLSIYQDDLDAY